MIYCKELDKSFETKENMFSALKEANKDIIASKKAKYYNDSLDNQKSTTTAKPIDISKLKDQVKGLDIDDAYYYIAVNTTKILDSHGDLHLNGIWNKTVKEQQGKNYLVADHELKAESVIVRKEHIEMFVAEIPFAMIGKSYTGSTEALIYKFRKDKVINPIYKEWLESGDAIEASVRMRYVDMLFALDSKDEEDKEYKKNFDQYINQIANKKEYENEEGEIYYFWPVKQAENRLESSLVLLGSNSSTGLVRQENKESGNHSKTIEPQESTPKFDLSKAIKETKFNIKN